VHHHLIRKGLRTSVGLVVESGEPREVHHFCCLAGYGAEAINPYLAFETLLAMRNDIPGKPDEKEIVKRYIKAVGKGILKVMSKMGISTYQSYCGAQIFDAVGLSQEFVAKYFTGTATKIEGAGTDDIARETARRHAEAFGDAQICAKCSTSAANTPSGCAAKRMHGPRRPCRSCSTPCAATRRTSTANMRILNEQSEKLLTIRGLFRIKGAKEDGRAPVAAPRSKPPRKSSSASPPAR
jgi:glutamate synthase (NADPH/NADH) large chain